MLKPLRFILILAVLTSTFCFTLNSQAFAGVFRKDVFDFESTPGSYNSRYFYLEGNNGWFPKESVDWFVQCESLRSSSWDGYSSSNIYSSLNGYSSSEYIFDL